MLAVAAAVAIAAADAIAADSAVNAADVAVAAVAAVAAVVAARLTRKGLESLIRVSCYLIAAIPRSLGKERAWHHNLRACRSKA